MNVKTIATLLKLAVILAVVGFAGMQCFSAGYSHYETQAESGLEIPNNSSDINVYSALSTWTCYDFKTDFESYQKWVEGYKAHKLSQIEINTEDFMSYSKKQDKLLYRKNIKHMKAFWESEGQAVSLIYVEGEGRAYYAYRSR